MTISLITFLKTIRPGYSINENDATFVTSPSGFKIYFLHVSLR